MPNDSTDLNPLQSEAEFLTVRQVAKYLNISQGSVYRLCAAKTLGHYKFGEGSGAIRISRTDLDEFTRSCRVEKQDANVQTAISNRRSGTKINYTFKCLDLRPQHACGVMTKAGTPCTKLTRDERCGLHQHFAKRHK